MVLCACGRKAVFYGKHKPKGEYLFECECGKKSWYSQDSLNDVDLKEIQDLFEKIRGKIPPPSPPPKVKPKLKEGINVSKLSNITKAQENKPKTVTTLYDVLQKLLDNIFKDTLAKKKKGYYLRPAQVALSQRLLKTLYSGGVVVSEAGVGTGKTYAYSIPTLILKDRVPRFRGPVIISTKTITLQEQLESDINDLKSLLGVAASIPVLVCKGSYNYICTEKLAETAVELPQTTINELEFRLKKTRFGDINEIQDLLEPEFLDKVRANECYGRCLQKNTCPFFNHKLERKSFNEGILICNHNLLVADLNMRQEDDAEGLWPDPAAIIIDEAHGLEQACRDTQGKTFSIKEYNYIKKLINSNTTGASSLGPIFTKIDPLVAALFKIVKEVERETEKDENNRFLVPVSEKLIKLCKKLYNELSYLEEQNQIISSFGQDRYGGTQVKGMEKLNRAGKVIRNILRALKDFVSAPGKYYAAGERISGKLAIFLGPIEVDQFLLESLWKNRAAIPVVLTSGTLAEEGSFNLVKKRLGLTFDDKLDEFFGPQQLDLSAKVGIYIPSDLPKPSEDDDNNDKGFTRAMAERVYQLIKISGGRALVLFTSYKRLNYVSQYLKKMKLPFPIYKQRDFPQGILIEKFRREETSVLLATGSYWEGVDVVGSSLSLLILDKLPFPAPGDPLAKARIARLEEQGLSGFKHLMLPEMLLRLRQGSGRLIRHEDDTGVIALLDSRTKGKSYASKIMNALPSGSEMGIEEIRNFFVSIESRNNKKTV